MDRALPDQDFLTLFADLQFGVDELSTVDVQYDSGSPVRRESAAFDVYVVAADGQVREDIVAMFICRARTD